MKCELLWNKDIDKAMKAKIISKDRMLNEAENDDMNEENNDRNETVKVKLKITINKGEGK